MHGEVRIKLTGDALKLPVGRGEHFSGPAVFFHKDAGKVGDRLFRDRS